MDFPIVPSDVLLALEQRFPERSPNVGETHDELMLRAGQASVVRLLRPLFTMQQDNILTSEFQDVPSVRQDP
jgi:hypothetical protein